MLPFGGNATRTSWSVSENVGPIRTVVSRLITARDRRWNTHSRTLPNGRRGPYRRSVRSVNRKSGEILSRHAGGVPLPSTAAPTRPLASATCSRRRCPGVGTRNPAPAPSRPVRTAGAPSDSAADCTVPTTCRMTPSFWSAICSRASASARATAAADLSCEGIVGPSGRLLKPRTLQPALKKRHTQIELAYRIRQIPQFLDARKDASSDDYPSHLTKNLKHRRPPLRRRARDPRTGARTLPLQAHDTPACCPRCASAWWSCSASCG